MVCSVVIFCKRGQRLRELRLWNWLLSHSLHFPVEKCGAGILAGVRFGDVKRKIISCCKQILAINLHEENSCLGKLFWFSHRIVQYIANFKRKLHFIDRFSSSLEDWPSSALCAWDRIVPHWEHISFMTKTNCLIMFSCTLWKLYRIHKDTIW